VASDVERLAHCTDTSNGKVGDPFANLPPPFHQQPSILSRVKRATVRIAMYDKAQRRILNVGSGVVIKGSCGEFAQVLTCAHNFLNMQTDLFQFLYGRTAEQVAILIGTYSSDDKASKWSYSAELVTQVPLITEMAPFGATSQSLLDLAVLRVNRSVEVTPPWHQGLGPLGPEYQLGPEYPKYSPENPCPLRECGLERGDPSKVATGSSGEVTAAGWYSQDSETNLFMASDYKVIGIDPSGLLISDTVLDSGGSGGPLLDRNGDVVAINSMSRSGKGMPYKSYARMITKLRPEHGLKD